MRDSRLTTLANVGAVVAGLLVLAQHDQSPPEVASQSHAAPAASDAAIAETQDHIAAAQADRPVPADLFSATERNAAAQL